MQECISLAQSHSLGEALDMIPQSRRRERYPSDQGLKQQRRDPLPFRGDEDKEDSEGYFPPLAWMVIMEEDS